MRAIYSISLSSGRVLRWQPHFTLLGQATFRRARSVRFTRRSPRRGYAAAAGGRTPSCGLPRRATGSHFHATRHSARAYTPVVPVWATPWRSVRLAFQQTFSPSPALECAPRRWMPCGQAAPHERLARGNITFRAEGAASAAQGALHAEPACRRTTVNQKQPSSLLVHENIFWAIAAKRLARGVAAPCLPPK